jgi:four helix bundle protein
MMSPPFDLRERVFQFACGVFDFCEELAQRPGMGRRIAYQLFDAASSIGANLEEAKAAYSRREFAAKNSISLKESRESKYWLRLADAKSLGNEAERRQLLKEADALVAMLTVGVNRLKRDQL